MKLSKKDPVILTLYGHYSHSRNIEVIDCAQEKGVHIICLPPHSTLKLKPLELFFRQPLKTYYTQEMKITHYQITELVAKACLKSATAAIAANGFRKIGLSSCNRHIFDGHDHGRISTQHHEWFA